MAEKIKIWYDPEGDYLEIILRKAPGHYEETELDQVMKKVDVDGRLIGFSILRVSSLKGPPFELSLAETA
jgi:uncharacterized protein YuzE